MAAIPSWNVRIDGTLSRISGNPWDGALRNPGDAWEDRTSLARTPRRPVHPWSRTLCSKFPHYPRDSRTTDDYRLVGRNALRLDHLIFGEAPIKYFMFWLSWLLRHICMDSSKHSTSTMDLEASNARP